MRDKEYPIFFTDGTCVHCGAKDSVICINKFGYPSKGKEDLYPISQMRCMKCKTEYFIMWETEEKDKEFSLPIAISRNYIDLFAQVCRDSMKDLESYSDKYI